MRLSVLWEPRPRFTALHRVPDFKYRLPWIVLERLLWIALLHLLLPVCWRDPGADGPKSASSRQCLWPNRHELESTATHRGRGGAAAATRCKAQFHDHGKERVVKAKTKGNFE